MFRSSLYVLLAFCAVFSSCRCQDFAAEMTRQCLVPDPVGLVDCVEEKVTLPYLTSWVECTNSLGQNVKTSADIVNYRCKSVWEGKELIPEVFYIKDCVIEKTGLPAKNVSAEVLGAYKECESTPSPQQQRIKGGPVQQQQMRVSSVQYNPSTQQAQAPVIRPQQQLTQARVPIQQTPAPFQPQNVAPRQQFQSPVQRQMPVAVQRPVSQQIQAPVQRPVQQQFQAPVQRPVQQQFQAPVQRPVQQQFQAPVQRPVQQQIQAPAQRPVQQQFQAPVQRPVQQQIQAPVFRPVQQAPPMAGRVSSQQAARPVQLTQQQVSTAFSPQAPSAVPRPQYPAPANPTNQRQPFSQQFFAIYPQAPYPNKRQQVSSPVLTQKTAPSPPMVSQQQILASTQQVSSINPNVPYTYSFQINHPMRPAL